MEENNKEYMAGWAAFHEGRDPERFKSSDYLRGWLDAESSWLDERDRDRDFMEDEIYW